MAIFNFIGFSIRVNDVRRFKFHKPGIKIITICPMLAPPHPVHDLPKAWDLLGEYLPYTKIDGPMDISMCSSFSSIVKYYNNLPLSERELFNLLAFAIDEKDFYTQFNDEIKQWASKFAHEVDLDKDFIFCGFDTMDYYQEASLITSCGINWKEIERCGKLNKYHLFEEYKYARVFADFNTDKEYQVEPYNVWIVYKYNKYSK